MDNNRRNVIVAALVGAVAGAGIHALTLKWCYKEEVVDGLKKITCEKKYSCTPKPPWNKGCP
jgi:hypothetical protein